MNAISGETRDFITREALHEEAVQLACVSAMLMCAARLQEPEHIREIMVPMRSTCLEAIRLYKLLETSGSASK